MGDIVLEVTDLSVEAWGAQLLHGVSLQLAAGEVMAIIGPNGAGKSTLLNTIVGTVHQQQHTQGSIVCCGRSLPQWNSESKAKSIAIMPQLSTLNFPFTVEEVVKLSRIPHQTGVELDQAIIYDALKALDIHYLTQRIYTQLSGGERQRVQLARVMAQIWRREDAEQRLLLLDEPTSSLDLGHQQQLMQALREFAQQGVGVLMVAHDINLVAQYADKLLALSCGQVVAQGEPSSVVVSDLMSELFQVDVRVIEHPETSKPVIVFAE